MKKFLLGCFLISSNLSSMTLTSALIDASDDFAVALMGDHFENTRTDDEQIRFEHACEKTQSRIANIVIGGCKAAAVGGISYYLSSDPNFIMFVGMITMGFRDKIEGILDSFTRAVIPDEKALRLDKLELDAKLKKNIPASYKCMIDDLIMKSRREIQTQSRFINRDEELKKIFAKLEVLLQLPTTKKAISKEPKSVTEELRAKMGATYEPKLIKKLEKLVFKWVSQSQRSNDIHRDADKTVLYFLGAPGTGKTTTAKNIAEVLGLPFSIINLSNIEPSQLLGSRFDLPNSPFCPSAITEALIKAGHNAATNTIIFLDEVHDVLRSENKLSPLFQSALKRLLDSDSGTFYDESLNLNIDISNVIFILAGNARLDDVANALLDRLTTFTFIPASAEARRLISAEDIKQELSLYNLDIAPDTLDSVIKAIHHEDMSTVGVRALKKVIRSLATHLAAQRAGVLSQDDEFDIQDEFIDARGFARDAENEIIMKE